MPVKLVSDKRKGLDKLKLKKRSAILLSALAVTSLLTGCGRNNTNNQITHTTASGEKIEVLRPGEEITELEPGLSMVNFEGNDGFEQFLEQGGASSDEGVIEFLVNNLGEDVIGLLFGNNPFGCSTLTVTGENGEAMFGRNFDWNTCEALVVTSTPENGYASISTVNRDFISGTGVPVDRLPDNIQAMVSLYAPLDGMNEEGLAVSVNMIQDTDIIEQNTDSPDVTTTTAIRLMLNQAANVEEALELLEQYDMHASMGMMVHFAIADRSGRSVGVEYVDNEMMVTETPIVTNFYLAEGEKQGIGTAQSHERFDILENLLEEKETFTQEDVRDALSSVSKRNFGEFETTEWSIIYSLESGQVQYYHRENYNDVYTLSCPGTPAAGIN